MPMTEKPDLTPLFNRIQDSAMLSSSDAYILASAFTALTDMKSDTRAYQFGVVLEIALQSYPPE